MREDYVYGFGIGNGNGNGYGQDVGWYCSETCFSGATISSAISDGAEDSAAGAVAGWFREPKPGRGAPTSGLHHDRLPALAAVELG